MCNFKYTVKVFWKKGVCDLDIEEYKGFYNYDIQNRNILRLIGDEYEQYILLENVYTFEVKKEVV